VRREFVKRNVILVTDGDKCAKKAVETAAVNIGGRCISRSAGNPTPLTGKEIIEYVKDAKYDPVVVMVDDRGNTHMGPGEEALEYILKSEDINVMGVIAVASNTNGVKGIKIDRSIDREGNVIPEAVDKYGISKDDKIIKGDTVDVLNKVQKPVIIGIGDPGKMDGFDDFEIGAPIITKAMEEILKINNYSK
jgi:stage V sporulation protein AE